MEKDAFIMQLRQMIEIKDKTSKILASIDCCIGNSLLESLIRGISLDAKKHAEIFRGLLDRAQGLNQAIAEEDKQEACDKINKVLELEWNVKNLLKPVIDKMVDDKTKKILNTILGDSQKQEAALKNILDLVSSMTIEEESVLDKIWKYSVKFDDDE